MMSEVSTMWGMSARSRRTLSRYCPRVYPRFMAASTRSHPDCTGRWKWGAAFSQRAMVSNSFSPASLGWLVMKRMRKSPGTALTRSSRSAKSTPSPRSFP